MEAKMMSESVTNSSLFTALFYVGCFSILNDLILPYFFSIRIHFCLAEDMKKRIILHLRNRSYSNKSIDYLASVRSEIQALKELKLTLEERVHNAARSKGLQHEEAVQPLEISSDKNEDNSEPCDHHHNQTLCFESESSNAHKRDDPIIRRITFEDDDEGWSAMKTRYAR
uniref:AlNc14C89G5618 protein n=1 Tax=Albugo laibachii Nc14 TaxID=890382 RepID=F0WG88_9STRA|nr:AlNc14C89G5618 [Albugo laibachii Nc14]|eukprot:CCA20223.1 AlNc14C89G5618 [Albugo laibachii Nc14]